MGVAIPKFRCHNNLSANRAHNLIENTYIYIYHVPDVNFPIPVQAKGTCPRGWRLLACVPVLVMKPDMHTVMHACMGAYMTCMCYKYDYIYNLGALQPRL